MSANRKEYRSSNRVSFHEPVSNVSVRGHRRQASDSGVGSDHDSYDASPDRSKQALYDLQKTHSSLKDEHAKLQEAFRNLTARFKAIENTNEVLEDDKKKLAAEKRTLREENQKLRDDLHKARSNQTRDRDVKMTGAIPAQPPSPKEKIQRSASKARRSESKAPGSRSSEDREREERKERKERKEREKRHEEDKLRLKGRFELKDSTDDGSVSSGSSTRKSYIEPYGPSAPRSTAAATTTSMPERPRRKRADSSFTSSRPQVNLNVTTYDDSAAYDNGTYLAEDGNYYPYPLQAVQAEPPRGRQY
ncbi:hypothetical protein CkaCkLH20_04739 [Colletotrichum karsti]|uniref:Uncharacterized protein n=1 Tax=Colletotrichum karsti TaxID=1095194 RepID=A0A9P6LIS9_9PEZI|nr:uncharacterized protein CkaCkLH20_04739 [Colletotrichum karsti]KAF9877604.1 hypothetical protein CkaCkLH20_04739 [Colletotrichum karsti]